MELNQQLQKTLQNEVLHSEEQRAFIEVLREVLEKNLDNIGLLEYLEEAKNSSQEKTLDIYVEMLRMKQTLEQQQLKIEEFQGEKQMIFDQLSQNSKKTNLVEHRTLLKQIDELKKEALNYKEESEKVNIEKDQLLEYLDNIQLEQEELIPKVQEQDNLLIEIKEKLAFLERKKVELEEELDVRDVKIKEEQQKVKESKKKLHLVQEKNERTAMSNLSLSEKLKDMESNQFEILDENEKLKEDIKTEQEYITQLNKKMLEIQNNIGQTTITTKEYEEKIQDLIQDLDQMNENNGKLTDQAQDLMEERNNISNMYEDLKERHQQEQANSSNELKGLIEQTSKFRSEIRDKQEAITGLEDQINNMMSSEKIQKIKEDQIVSAMNEIEEIRIQFVEKEGLFQEYEEAITELRILVEDENIEPKQIAVYMENLIDDNTAMVEDNKNLNERLEEIVVVQAQKTEIINEQVENTAVILTNIYKAVTDQMGNRVQNQNFNQKEIDLIASDLQTEIKSLLEEMFELDERLSKTDEIINSQKQQILEQEETVKELVFDNQQLLQEFNSLSENIQKNEQLNSQQHENIQELIQENERYKDEADQNAFKFEEKKIAIQELQNDVTTIINTIMVLQLNQALQDKEEMMQKIENEFVTNQQQLQNYAITLEEKLEDSAVQNQYFEFLTEKLKKFIFDKEVKEILDELFLTYYDIGRLTRENSSIKELIEANVNAEEELTTRELEDLKQELKSKEQRVDVLETKKVALENEISRFEKRDLNRNSELSMIRQENRELTDKLEEIQNASRIESVCRYTSNNYIQDAFKKEGKPKVLTNNYLEEEQRILNCLEGDSKANISVQSELSSLRMQLTPQLSERLALTQQKEDKQDSLSRTEYFKRLRDKYLTQEKSLNQ